jgi:hypothetical protein
VSDSYGPPTAGHRAWSIAEEWLVRRTSRSGRRDEDFFGLAACEFWKRLLSDRPSVEMLDDWMPSAYIVLADFHSHLFPGERVLPLDLGRAESDLRHALPCPASRRTIVVSSRNA